MATGYVFMDSDITSVLQQGIDKSVTEYPNTPPPEGFVWKALVKQVPDKDSKYTYIIEWLAKPNGS